jgi:Flp pilus assembly protein CpaB
MRLRRITRSPLVYWLCVVVLASATGLIVARVLAEAEAARTRYGSPRRVAVARRALAVGRVIGAADVRTRAVPAALAPEGAVLDAAAAVGRTVVVPLFRGQAVLAAHLAPDGVQGVAAALGPGSRAVAVPTGAGGRPPVRAGDSVDVLVVVDPQPAAVVAAAAVVVDVAEESVTLAVSAAEAELLAQAVTRGALTLAVRSPIERP